MDSIHSDAAKAESASKTEKSAKTYQRANIKMVQNVLLVWLDTDVEKENHADYQNTISQLQRLINNINTFTDHDQCIEFIDNIDYSNNKVCLVISGSRAQATVPRIHHMYQVDSIFIFHNNKKRRERWTKNWVKIKGVFTEIALICVALKQAAQQCEYNAIPMSFMATSGGISKKTLDQLDCSFMYTQILKDILSTITFEQKYIQEFSERCCLQFADIKEELISAEQLERNYRNKTPIWWYTCESFVYPMVNGALRLIDVDVTIKMGFFLADLCHQIQQLHKEQTAGHRPGKAFMVYRGQGMSTEDFQQMRKTESGLMAFNGFLSTSKSQDVSLDFARRTLVNPDLIGILFAITIDPSQSTTPFASTNGIGYLQDQDDEIIFSMHTVFRITEIKSVDGNHRLYQVKLTLINNNDKDFRALTERIGTEAGKSTGWDRLGLMLFKMGQSDKAHQVYDTLLEQATKESEKGDIYYQIGRAKHMQEEYREALKFYQTSLTVREQLFPLNHRDLSRTYNRIGLVYDNISNWSQALLYYEKALDINKKALAPNHPDIAASHNNIGAMYRNMGDFLAALSSHEKALEIQKQSLRSNHPDLAKTYIARGIVYNQMGKHSEAITSYEKALEIQQKSLPENHSDLAMSYNNIGNVYNNIGEYTIALSYYEKDLAITQNTLPQNHPDLAASHNNIGNLYKNLGDYPKAILFHEKALEIRQSLPANHPDLASSYNNLGLVYESMRNYSKARSLFKRAVNIGQQSLSANHPTLQTFKNNLNRVKHKL
jgi:tetratricopeptide (TPR) repeat protein